LKSKLSARSYWRALGFGLPTSEVEQGPGEAEQRPDLGHVLRLRAGFRGRPILVQTAVHDAKLNVGYCTVRAPFDGLITNLNIAVGQDANAGREIFAVVDARSWYV